MKEFPVFSTDNMAAPIGTISLHEREVEKLEAQIEESGRLRVEAGFTRSPIDGSIQIFELSLSPQKEEGHARGIFDTGFSSKGSETL